MPEASRGVPSFGTVASSGVRSFGSDVTASELAYPAVPAPPELQEGVCSFATDVTASELDYPAPRAPVAADDGPAQAPPAGQAAASAGAAQQGGPGDAGGAPAGSQDAPWGQLPIGMPVAPLPMGYPVPMMAPLYLGPMGGVPPETDMDGPEYMAAFALQQAEAWRTVAEASEAWKYASQGYPEGEGTTTTGASSGALGEASWTTVTLRNLPTDYDRDMLLRLLDDRGFKAKYDFVYLPADFKSMEGLGYAFVNMESHAEALAVWERLDGFSDWVPPNVKVCQVAWSIPHQGLAAHVERYRNSPVMHPDVDDKFKPIVFKHGQRQDFPAPTKQIRRPRLKYHHGERAVPST